jgi:hypothetical protein
LVWALKDAYCNMIEVYEPWTVVWVFLLVAVVEVLLGGSLLQRAATAYCVPKALSDRLARKKDQVRALRVKIKELSSPDFFVECSLAQRKLLKAERALAQCADTHAQIAPSSLQVALYARVAKAVVFLALVVAFWSTPLFAEHSSALTSACAFFSSLSPLSLFSSSSSSSSSSPEAMAAGVSIGMKVYLALASLAARLPIKRLGL